jgi:hypothetical protein
MDGVIREIKRFERRQESYRLKPRDGCERRRMGTTKGG